MKKKRNTETYQFKNDGFRFISIVFLIFFFYCVPKSLAYIMGPTVNWMIQIQKFISVKKSLVIVTEAYHLRTCLWIFYLFCHCTPSCPLP